MRTFWIVQAGIGVAAIGASAALGVACSGTVVDTGTHSENDTDTETETDTGPETDTDTADCFTPPCTGVSCHDCACVNKSGDTPAGCADTCDNILGATTTPNFCNGAPALMMCEMCIAQRCNVSDPTQCD